MGQIPRRASILSISNATRCEIEIDVDPGFITGNQVRLTDLNGVMPNPRGMDPLNNYKFEIIMTGDLTFTIHDPVTHLPINSTNFTPYVEGGSCTLLEQDFFYHSNEEE